MMGVEAGVGALAGSEQRAGALSGAGKSLTPVGEFGRSTPFCLCVFAKNNCRCAASFSLLFAIDFNRFDVLRMGTLSSLLSHLITSSSATSSSNVTRALLRFFRCRSRCPLSVAIDDGKCFFHC